MLALWVARRGGEGVPSSINGFVVGFSNGLVVVAPDPANPTGVALRVAVDDERGGMLLSFRSNGLVVSLLRDDDVEEEANGLVSLCVPLRGGGPSSSSNGLLGGIVFS